MACGNKCSVLRSFLEEGAVGEGLMGEAVFTVLGQGLRGERRYENGDAEGRSRWRLDKVEVGGCATALECGHPHHRDLQRISALSEARNASAFTTSEVLRSSSGLGSSRAAPLKCPFLIFGKAHFKMGKSE